MATDWNELYRNTFPDLVRFLLHKVWDEDRARDLAQEAFVRALRHEPSMARSWLFQVAANLARDEARMVLRRKRHLALLKTERESALPVGEEHDPLAEMDREARWRSVREALDTLNERDRDVLLLWDAGQSYSEIAKQTGLAVGAVGTTLARARRRLVEAYRDKEEADVAR